MLFWDDNAARFGRVPYMTEQLAPERVRASCICGDANESVFFELQQEILDDRRLQSVWGLDGHIHALLLG